MPDLKKLEARFTYHPPKADQLPRYQDIRDDARHFALRLVQLCPESEELDAALRHLDQVVMFANASIARNE